MSCLDIYNLLVQGNIICNLFVYLEELSKKIISFGEKNNKFWYNGLVDDYLIKLDLDIYNDDIIFPHKINPHPQHSW